MATQFDRPCNATEPIATLASAIGVTPTQAVFRGFAPRLILCIFVVVSGMTAVWVLSTTLRGTAVGTRDFVSYWAAAKLLLHGANPYSASAVAALESAAGRGGENLSLIMRNPPTALFVVIPLGWMGARVGSILWSLVLIVCLGGSLRMIWRINGSPATPHYLFGYLFAPALAGLGTGQTGIFALLGLVLFLRLHHSKPLLAGIALSLCALKPHLFLPFAVALFAWIATRKAYSILAGAALAMGVCCAIPLFWDRSVWSQYVRMAQTSGIKNEFMPDLSTILRFAIDRDAMWLQFLPAAAACMWTLWYFHRHRVDWDWKTHGSLLMLVSVLAAPYSWFNDQVILLPALLYGIYSGRSLVALLALTSATVIEMLFAVSLHSPLHCWPAVAWLVWYLWPTRDGRNSEGLPAMA